LKFIINVPKVFTWSPQILSFGKVRSVEFVNEFVFKLSVLEDEILFNCEGSVRFKDDTIIFSVGIFI